MMTLSSIVKRVDRVPTLSINSLHPYHFDRIGILSARDSTIIRIPAHAGILSSTALPKSPINKKSRFLLLMGEVP